MVFSSVCDLASVSVARKDYHKGHLVLRTIQRSSLSDDNMINLVCYLQYACSREDFISEPGGSVVPGPNWGIGSVLHIKRANFQQMWI